MRILSRSISICLVLVSYSSVVAAIAAHQEPPNKAAILSKPDIEEVYRPRKKGSLTFNKDIAPIVFGHCSSCHRPGEVGPFSLLSYSDVKKHATDIANITARKLMPPWKADSHGEFEGENRLTGDQIGLLRQWADETRSEGYQADLPETPTFTPGWQMGPPDAVLTPQKEYVLAASGGDEVHTFLLPTDFAENRYLSAVDVRPGNRAIVHHTIVSVDAIGKFRNLAEEGGRMDFPGGIGSPEGVLDVWSAGKVPGRLPKGVGMPLPKGVDVVIEIHYHRSGKPEKDRTQVGLYFCKEPVSQVLHVHGLDVSRLSIAPGDANYRTAGQVPVLVDSTLLSIFPHMHQIGKSMTVTLVRPDGTQQTLITVPDWDYGWQNTYHYRHPVKLPQGSLLKVTAVFDNSAANPRNPNRPPKHIDYGERSVDEMGLVLLAFTVDAENVRGPDP